MEIGKLVTLEEIRQAGLVDKIGFSGDNEDLRAASNLEIFDYLMFSLNPLDLRNLKFLNQNSKTLPVVFKVSPCKRRLQYSP